jgi:hypothetical protein
MLARAAKNNFERIAMRRSCLPAVLVLLVSPPAFSDGGMWTFHDFPQDLVKRQYGADISSAWLDRVRTATIRLSNCTASFVSPDGLILTNHHCAEACLDEHSSSERNLVRSGFLARSREPGAQVRNADRRRTDGRGERHRQGRSKDQRTR